MGGGTRPVKVLALTPAGSRLARRLCQSLEGVECWLPASRAAPGVQTFDSLAAVFAEAFARGHHLVCIMAAGIVVRGIAPYLRSKETDPAVVVVDEEGRFAVSLLCGHLGGANELARRVAAALGGMPVITTATDVQGLPALEVVAAQAGLVIENLSGVKEVSMALLSGRSVRLVDPEGFLLPFLEDKQGLFHREDNLEACLASPAGPAVYVGILERPWPSGWLRLRPRTLIAGVGCHRGTTAEEILDFLRENFQQAGLSLLSLKALATVAVKKDEPGLQEAARRLKVELLWFAAEELEQVSVPHPSGSVARHVGAKSVCEAAALKAAQGDLLVPKRKGVNVTVAVARVASRS